MGPVSVHQIAGAGVAVFAMLVLAKEFGKMGGDWPRYILSLARSWRRVADKAPQTEAV